MNRHGRCDPIDSPLVAKALAEDIPLLSNDAVLDQYGIRRIWWMTGAAYLRPPPFSMFRSTVCRIPPFLKYSISTGVSIRQTQVNSTGSPSA